MSLSSPAQPRRTFGPWSNALLGDAIQAALASPRIGGLDFLRAVAVSLVLLAHAVELQTGLYGPISELGALGVEIFFVLSGFLITRLLLDEIDTQGRIDFLAFYRRRIARLMPAFYLYLIIGLTVLWVREKTPPWGAIVSSMLYFVNYYQAFTGAQSNMVSHCWSLAVEEQFYLIWPLLASFLFVRRMNIAKALVIVVLSVWCWRVFLTLAVDAPVDYLYRALDTRADELAIGCLIAVLVRSREWRVRLATVLSVPGMGPALVGLICAAILLDSQGAIWKYCFGYMVEPVMIGGLVLMTVVASARGGWLAAILNNRLVVHVGQVSYFMYLIHGLVMYTTLRFVEARTGSFELGLVASFAAVIGAASLSFRWFEMPLRKLINGRPSGARPRGPSTNIGQSEPTVRD